MPDLASSSWLLCLLVALIIFFSTYFLAQQKVPSFSVTFLAPAQAATSHFFKGSWVLSTDAEMRSGNQARGNLSACLSDFFHKFYTDTCHSNAREVFVTSFIPCAPPAPPGSQPLRVHSGLSPQRPAPEPRPAPQRARRSAGLAAAPLHGEGA